MADAVTLKSNSGTECLYIVPLWMAKQEKSSVLWLRACAQRERFLGAHPIDNPVLGDSAHLSAPRKEPAPQRSRDRRISEQEIVGWAAVMLLMNQDYPWEKGEDGSG